MAMLQHMEWLDENFKPRAASVVKGEQTDTREQDSNSYIYRPISNDLQLGLGWTVAIWSDVVADIFNAVGEEFTISYF
mgnify:CR=1 FL=1